MIEFNNNWKVKSLGEIVRISKGKKLNSLVNSKTPTSRRFIQIDDLRNNEQLKFTEDNSGVLVNERDILIAWDGANAGTVGFGLVGFIGSTIARLELLEKNISTNYLGWLLRTKSKYLRDNCTGATIPHISKSILTSIKIQIPPLPIQKQIAEILEKADQAKQKRKEANKLTDEFLQSVFIEMFGDPKLNNMGWDKFKLGQITHLITDGKQGDCRNDFNSGYYFLSAKDINNLKINFSNARQIMKDDFEEVHRRTDLKPGDLLLVNTGATIGKVAILPEDKRVRKTTLQKSVAVIKPNSSIINVEYLKYCFLIALKEMVKSSSGSAQKNLLLSEIRNITLAIPPINLQNIFAEIVNKTEALKEKQKQSEQELENLFQSLMQKLLKES